MVKIILKGMKECHIRLRSGICQTATLDHPLDVPEEDVASLLNSGFVLEHETNKNKKRKGEV